MEIEWAYWAGRSNLTLDTSWKCFVTYPTPQVWDYFMVRCFSRLTQTLALTYAHFLMFRLQSFTRINRGRPRGELLGCWLSNVTGTSG